MTEEDASQRKKEHAERTEAVVQKDQRIGEHEGLLMRVRLRMEEGDTLDHGDETGARVTGWLHG